MRIAIASDHAAFERKEEVKTYLCEQDYEVIDFGPDSDASMDYPDTIKQAARSVRDKEADAGIVLCGSGIGADIVANKIRGVKALLCLDEYSAEYGKKHNDTNVLVLAGRRHTFHTVKRFIDIWLNTPFDGGRHQKRIDKITQVEEEELGHKS